MILARWTWVPPLAFLAGDFKVHIEHVARLQAEGGRPVSQGGRLGLRLVPLPADGRPVVRLGEVAGPGVGREGLARGQVALLFVAGAIEAWRARRALGLAEIPPAWVVVGVLYAAPTLFAMERGQSDPLVLLPLIVASWLLARGTSWAEFAAGIVLGAARG